MMSPLDKVRNIHEKSMRLALCEMNNRETCEYLDSHSLTLYKCFNKKRLAIYNDIKYIFNIEIKKLFKIKFYFLSDLGDEFDFLIVKCKNFPLITIGIWNA